MISALILAGGLGTRLAQTVPYLPKALAPIQGIPFLQILLRQLQRANLFSKVILALGHKSSFIEHFLCSTSFPFPIEISIEPSPLGTGGAIFHALEKIDSDLFLTMNGDSYFDLSFSSFLHFHQAKQAAISIACTEIEDAARYGSIEMDTSQRILNFSEKSASSRKGWISTGIYLLQKSLFTNLPHVPCSLEKDLFPRFLEKGLFGYSHRGTFIDIGTHHSYMQAQETLKPWISS